MLDDEHITRSSSPFGRLSQGEALEIQHVHAAVRHTVTIQESRSEAEVQINADYWQIVWEADVIQGSRSQSRVKQAATGTGATRQTRETGSDETERQTNKDKQHLEELRASCSVEIEEWSDTADSWWTRGEQDNKQLITCQIFRLAEYLFYGDCSNKYPLLKLFIRYNNHCSKYLLFENTAVSYEPSKKSNSSKVRISRR